MDNIVCCLVGILDAKTREKIAEMLRIHQIEITDDIKLATRIIHIPDNAPQMTIEEIALDIIKKNQAQVFKLQKHFDMSNITVILPSQNMHKNNSKVFNQKHILKQYNKNKQIQKQTFFNRTKCK